MKFGPRSKRRLAQLETDIEKLDSLIHKVEDIRNKKQGELNRLLEKRERVMHPEKYCESCKRPNVQCYCGGC